MQHRLAWDRLMQMQHLHHCQGFLSSTQRFGQPFFSA